MADRLTSASHFFVIFAPNTKCDMIKKEDVLPIGRIVKAHGLKGELTMEVTNGVFDDIETEYLICEVDGILVPFLSGGIPFQKR
jgi:hypothetical protein